MSRSDSSTPLAKVRGLGSAHHGGHHWLEERFTSVALIFLSLWLIFSLVMLPALDRGTVNEWLGSAWGAIPMALLIVTAFRHGLDGLKVANSDEGNAAVEASVRDKVVKLTGRFPMYDYIG